MRDAPLEDLPDEELMLAYAAGDAGAFARLYDRHERAVHRFLLRSVRSPEIADGLLQDTWMAVVRNASGYAPRARFTTWLYGIARSKLIDHWRRTDPAASLDDPVANDPDSSLVDYSAADAAFQPEVRALSRAQARAFVDAVEAKPRAVGRMRRWRFPLAAAATVLISAIAVLVATRTEQEAAKLAAAPPETGAQPPADIYAPQPAAAAPADAPPARSTERPAPRAQTAQAAPPAPQAAPPAAAPAERFEAPAVAAAPAAADAGATGEARAEPGAANGGIAGLRAARERTPATTTTELAPAQWIERIVALRAGGRDDEADRELKRFRERHPDFKLLPPALRRAPVGK